MPHRQVYFEARHPKARGPEPPAGAGAHSRGQAGVPRAACPACRAHQLTHGPVPPPSPGWSVGAGLHCGGEEASKIWGEQKSEACGRTLLPPRPTLWIPESLGGACLGSAFAAAGPEARLKGERPENKQNPL